MLLTPWALNRIGFRLYARFCTGVPEGGQGCGAKRELRVMKGHNGRLVFTIHGAPIWA